MIRKLAFIGVLFWCAILRAETITVSAAISLKEALGDVAKQYAADTNDQVNLNFGASGLLASQIEQGAPVDLFVSAGAKQVDALVKDGLADPATRTAVATNELVLIVPAGAKNPPAKFEDLTDPRFAHIAIGDPKTVPAGQYAMQTLVSLNLEEPLATRLVEGANVRQVLIYVSLGEADAGVVYATDAAQAGKKVIVAAVAPETSHDPIVYPAVILKAGKTDAAARFLSYLQSDKARAILIAHGFGVPAAATRP
ncbi:MAG: molybdate ABC transporter substrate-binding protein [Tepidisphaeraceae bacterium]|jgi:molybdate transport system substrate-binding protein